MRFDLCDRQRHAPCAEISDGVFRLVLQPTYTAVAGGGAELRAHDIALHAFYPVPAAELRDVVAELRALAALQAAPLDAPLQPSPALSAAASSSKYLSRLRALLQRYADAEHLTRLTVFGQDASSVAFAWILRGVERASLDGASAPIAIPSISSAQQAVRLGGGDTVYVADPIADVPAGFALALNGPRFNAASLEERQAAVAALVAIQNPALHDTGDTQCLSCHVATFLTGPRATGAAVDVTALP